MLGVQAQEPRFIFDNDSTQTASPDASRKAEAKDKETLKLDSLNKVPPAVPAWNIDPLLGERIAISMDTMLYGFHRETLVEGQGLAVGYLGNWGSPAYSKLFHEKEASSLFQFLDPYKFYYKTPGNHRFLSTKQPYSNIMYQSGGSRQSKEERFTGEMAISFNKRLTIGFDIDYVYSRGFYQYNSDKQISYDFYAAYVGDKYQMHAFVGNNNYTNSENGGINFDDKDADPIGKGNSLNYPTFLSQTWNYLRGKHLYINNRYNLGYNKEDTQQFIPVASIILTNYYTDQRRKFHSKDIEGLDDFYNLTNNSAMSVNDQMAYYSFKNTVGIALNEGFREWVKFGLTAYIQHDKRVFRMPLEELKWLATKDESESSTFIGGKLAKEKGEVLKYNLGAELGIAGFDAGGFNLNADISTAINIKGQKAVVRANAYIKNLVPQYFQKNFVSIYYNWSDPDLKNTQRVYVGGEIYVPHTQTRLSGGVENLTNYTYIHRNPGESSAGITPRQADARIITLRLDQNLHYGILHWDNQIAYQMSDDKSAIPVPTLSLYSNLYIKTSLAKVLSIQLGVDVNYQTKYYAQSYDPALGQFINQSKEQVGNFPFANAYANFHLKKTRFFVMMYNIAEGYGNSNYFTVPTYPINPMIFKFGLSWNFTN